MSDQNETVDDYIYFGLYLVVDDKTSDDEVHVITPDGMVDNSRRYYFFPVLTMCKGCLGPAIFDGESEAQCVAALQEAQ